MSAPAPAMVNRPLEYDALPVRPTLPMSWVSQGPARRRPVNSGAVVNDHTGPVDVPAVLRATTRQKYT